MSVLKSHRTCSKAIFINKALLIEDSVFLMMDKVSSRISKRYEDAVRNLVFDLVNNCEMANSIYVNVNTPSHMRLLRKDYLIKARASLNALDVQLTRVYKQHILTPENSLDPLINRDSNTLRKAQKFDKLANNLGVLIDDEKTILSSLIRKL